MKISGGWKVRAELCPSLCAPPAFSQGLTVSDEAMVLIMGNMVAGRLEWLWSSHRAFISYKESRQSEAWT